MADRIYLTNDGAVINQNIEDRMMSAFGSVEVNYLKNAKLVAYQNVETGAEPSGEAASDAVLLFLHELQKLQLALWIVQDNAASFENAFLVWPVGAPRAVVHKNHWEGSTSFANGETVLCSFSREQLRAARKIHESLWSRAHPVKLQAAEPTEPEVGRFPRALYFLQAARREAALSVKVAEYCSALESLLSTDASELSHKLGERLAWLLAREPKDRVGLYRRVKKLYSIRSHAVHGSSLPRKTVEQELQSAAQVADTLLRSLIGQIAARPALRALYLESEANKDQLEEALLSLTHGANPEMQPNSA